MYSSCATCHLSCLTCNGSSETQCITCRTGRFAFDGKCLNSCPDGYYGDKKRQECMPCPNGCATCTNNGFCLTCKEHWTKNKKNRCIVSGSEHCDECKFFFFLFLKHIPIPTYLYTKISYIYKVIIVLKIFCTFSKNMFILFYCCICVIQLQGFSSILYLH